MDDGAIIEHMTASVVDAGGEGSVHCREHGPGGERGRSCAVQ
jgi:hypothetical protein